MPRIPTGSLIKKRGYIGGMLEMANDRLYPFWGDLEKAMETGNPQNEIKHKNTEFFEILYENKERLNQFTRARGSDGKL